MEHPWRNLQMEEFIVLDKLLSSSVRCYEHSDIFIVSHSQSFGAAERTNDI
jgi:hypothetical protein